MLEQKYYAVIQDCLSYLTSPEEDRDGTSINSNDLLESEASYDRTVYTNKERAEAKAAELNKQRWASGARNRRWNYYVVELTLDQA